METVLAALASALLAGAGVWFVAARENAANAVRIAHLEREVDALRESKHHMASEVTPVVASFPRIMEGLDDCDRRITALEKRR
jgi:hypothetical protein